MRSNNKVYGSPVNRINIMAQHAASALGEIEASSDIRARTRRGWNGRLANLKFHFSLFLMTLGFKTTRMLQHLRRLVLRIDDGDGFEERIDNRMKDMMMEQFGIKVDVNAFDG